MSKKELNDDQLKILYAYAILSPKAQQAVINMLNSRDLDMSLLPLFTQEELRKFFEIAGSVKIK